MKFKISERKRNDKINTVLQDAKFNNRHHCNANNFKTLLANYMPIRILCVHGMVKYVGKISFEISSYC